MPQAFITISIAATFSSNGLIINENTLKVEKTDVHLKLQMAYKQLTVSLNRLKVVTENRRDNIIDY